MEYLRNNTYKRSITARHSTGVTASTTYIDGSLMCNIYTVYIMLLQRMWVTIATDLLFNNIIVALLV